MSAMRSLIFSVLVLAAVPLAHAQVSISGAISGQVAPGVYGQVTIGGGPPPPVVYAQPVIAVLPPAIAFAPPVQPIYLRVPPGHEKHWDKHCHEYNACNRPVYFVKSAENEDSDHHKHHNKHDD